jgi:hypothetical protein
MMPEPTDTLSEACRGGARFDMQTSTAVPTLCLWYWVCARLSGGKLADMIRTPADMLFSRGSPALLHPGLGLVAGCLSKHPS